MGVDSDIERKARVVEAAFDPGIAVQRALLDNLPDSCEGSLEHAILSLKDQICDALEPFLPPGTQDSDALVGVYMQKDGSALVRVTVLGQGRAYRQDAVLAASVVIKYA